MHGVILCSRHACGRDRGRQGEQFFWCRKNGSLIAIQSSARSPTPLSAVPQRRAQGALRPIRFSPSNVSTSSGPRTASPLPT